MKVSLISLVPVLLLVGMVALFALGLGKDPSLLPSVMVERPMPDFVLEPVLDNMEVFAPADLLGQISLVNVFGSWCAACLLEHPTLMRLAREQRIAIYGVNWRDSAENGANWLKQHGNPYVKVGLDEHSKMIIDLGVTGAPETYITDAQGRIRFKQVGPITEAVWHQTILPVVLTLEAET